MVSANILVALFWFWCLYPYNPLEMKQPLEVLNENKTVRAGEVVIYRAEYMKNTDILPKITRTLVDGIIYTLPPIIPINTRGKHDQIIYSLTIPPSIPAGTYTFDCMACYQMNPIREVCVSYSSEEFTVIK
jgi:hypothetical protein